MTRPPRPSRAGTTPQSLEATRRSSAAEIFDRPSRGSRGLQVDKGPRMALRSTEILVGVSGSGHGSSPLWGCSRRAATVCTTQAKAVAMAW